MAGLPPPHQPWQPQLCHHLLDALDDGTVPGADDGLRGRAGSGIQAISLRS